MLTRRVVYLGLLICLVTTTALGMHPKRMGSVLLEQEIEADDAMEESGEEEVEADAGFLVRRRGTALIFGVEVQPLDLRVPPRSLGSSVLVSCHARPFAEHNGFGGPLRL